MSGRILFRAASAGLRTAAPRGAPAARTYASAANTKPPVALFGLDGTYASALYTAAAKTNALDPTAKALATLHKTFVRDPKLSTVLASPTLTAADKKTLVTELLKAAQSSDATVKNFLQTLADNNRLGLLASVAAKFEQLMAAARGEVELRITSAAALDAKIVKQLEGAVGKSQLVGQGKALKTVARVDPGICGGLVVEVGDRTIDLSVSGKIARLNKVLTDAL